MHMHRSFLYRFFGYVFRSPGTLSSKCKEEQDTSNTRCSVGELCAKTGITRKTLFYYDRIGLLKPTARTGIQEHKYYDAASVHRLQHILRFRKAGLRIEEIRAILDDPACDIPTILQNAVQRCEAQQNTLKEQISLLKELMEEYPS